MATMHLPSSQRWRLLILLLAASLLLVACEKSAREETFVFQEAEALYKAGDYDGAAARYQSFIETYPRSPFARTAQLRLKTIDREIESVMGTRGTNRPIFIRPTRAETEQILAGMADGREVDPEAAEPPAQSIVPEGGAPEEEGLPTIVHEPDGAEGEDSTPPSDGSIVEDPPE